MFIAERHAEGRRRSVGRYLHHVEVFVGGEFGGAGHGHAGLEFLRRALAAGADDQEEVLGVRRDGEVALDDDESVALGGLP